MIKSVKLEVLARKSSLQELREINAMLECQKKALELSERRLIVEYNEMCSQVTLLKHKIRQLNQKIHRCNVQKEREEIKRAWEDLEKE